jgi:hypothetical protein
MSTLGLKTCQGIDRVQSCRQCNQDKITMQSTKTTAELIHSGRAGADKAGHLPVSRGGGAAGRQQGGMHVSRRTHKRKEHFRKQGLPYSSLLSISAGPVCSAGGRRRTDAIAKQQRLHEHCTVSRLSLTEMPFWGPEPSDSGLLGLRSAPGDSPVGRTAWQHKDARHLVNTGRDTLGRM